MDQSHYREMKESLDRLLSGGAFTGKEIYIFGHCNASEELINLLSDKGYRAEAILDNNRAKQGGKYRDVPIIPPQEITRRNMKDTIICIAARAYEAMARQLEQMKYSGRVEKLVDYNTFAEYSLSQETMARKEARLMRGMQIFERLRNEYPGCFFIVCPYSALGDVYYTMAYLPYYLERRKVSDYVVVTAGRACAAVADLFDCRRTASLTQKEMDELVQAVLFTEAQDAFIAHHDRPYPNLLMRALYVKFIPFEMIYRCGVFGLSGECEAYMPVKLKRFCGQDGMKKGRSVILSPYAKSVSGISPAVWEEIISHYRGKGYQVYTNIAGEEKALPYTKPLRAELSELQSAAEWAGIFIGIRSGLCDVIRGAECRKIVLFTDSCYSDTGHRAADFFHLEGWENIVVTK